MNDAVGQSVGRDEHGLYVKWDGLQIECKTGTVSLWLNTTKISDQVMLNQNLDTSNGVVL